MPRDTGAFKIKERVLVPHTDKPYEAKVTKAEKRENMWYYYIHYPGWNRQYDEWVEATGLMKFEAAPVDASVRAPSVQPEASVDVSEPAAEDLHLEASAAPVVLVPHPPQQLQHQLARPTMQDADRPPKKRVKRADNTPSGTKFDSDQLDFELPVQLKQVLLADYASIAEHHRQPLLPQKPCVADILSQYVEQSNSEGLDFEQEVAAGLQTYFDKCLQHMLLYQEEEQDAAEGSLPSTVYGGTYLLRLLLKLPGLLALHSLSSSSQDRLQAGLVDFIVFLEDNAGQFFKMQA